MQTGDDTFATHRHMGYGNLKNRCHVTHVAKAIMLSRRVGKASHSNQALFRPPAKKPWLGFDPLRQVVESLLVNFSHQLRRLQHPNRGLDHGLQAQLCALPRWLGRCPTSSVATSHASCANRCEAALRPLPWSAARLPPHPRHQEIAT